MTGKSDSTPCISVRCTWSLIAPGCTNGYNLETYYGKTVDDCKKICLDDPKCKSIEYMVDYGGSKMTYTAGLCVPQSSADSTGCDGKGWNLDLYVPSCERGTTIFVPTHEGQLTWKKVTKIRHVGMFYRFLWILKICLEI